VEINIDPDPVNARGPDITFVLGDKGSAHVSLTLSIPGVGRIEHDETFEGSLTRTLPINAGSYDCTLIIAAFRTGAFGPVYDSSLAVAGGQVASAKGSIPTDKDSDFAFKHFTLIVA